MHIKYEIPPGTQLDLFDDVSNINPSSNVAKTSVQQQWNIKYTFDDNGQPMWGGGHGGEE